MLNFQFAFVIAFRGLLDKVQAGFIAGPEVVPGIGDDQQGAILTDHAGHVLPVFVSCVLDLHLAQVAAGRVDGEDPRAFIIMDKKDITAAGLQTAGFVQFLRFEFARHLESRT